MLCAAEYERVQDLMDDLYEKLCEMVLWILHRRVTERPVWLAALNCILMMICHNAHVDKEKCVILLCVRLWPN